MRTIHFIFSVIAVIVIGSLGNNILDTQLQKQNKQEVLPAVAPSEIPIQATPTFAPTVVIQQNQAVQQTSPKIDCTGPDGKHFQTTQKECDNFNAAWKKQPTGNIVSCKLVSGYVIPTTLEDCNRYNAGNNTKPNTMPQITTAPYVPTQYYSCTLYYPSLKIYYTYNSLYKTKEECDAEQEKINQSVTLYQNPAPIPQPTKDSYCDTAVTNWIAFKENFNATQINNYSSSAEGVRVLYGYMQSYQQQANSHSCDVTLYL